MQERTKARGRWGSSETEQRAHVHYCHRRSSIWRGSRTADRRMPAHGCAAVPGASQYEDIQTSRISHTSISSMLLLNKLGLLAEVEEVAATKNLGVRKSWRISARLLHRPRTTISSWSVRLYDAIEWPHRNIHLLHLLGDQE